MQCDLSDSDGEENKEKSERLGVLKEDIQRNIES